MHMGSLGEWHVDWDSILLACEWNRMYTNYIKRANHSIYSVQSTVFLFNQFCVCVCVCGAKMVCLAEVWKPKKKRKKRENEGTDKWVRGLEF